MKKFVLSLFVTTAFAFGAQSQNSSTGDRPADAASQNSATGKQVTDADNQTTLVRDQAAADAIKTTPAEKKGCFRIASLSLSSGMNKYRELGADDKEWDKPQKGKNSWNSDDFGMMMGYGSGDILTKNQIILELGLNPWSKKMGNYNQKQEMTVSLFYSGSDLANRFHEEYFSTPGDTFSFNSVMYQTDTVARIQKTFVEKANVMGAGVQYLFKSDPERRFSVFAGVGLDFAFALSTRVYETYAKDSAVVLSFNGPKENEFGPMEFDNGNFLGSESSKTKLDSKPNLFTSVYVPFGVSLRLCKKKEIWNQFNLVLKGNLGLETAIKVGHSTSFNPFMGMSLGLKFDFK